MNIKYIFRSGKNPKFVYYAKAYSLLHLPGSLLRSCLHGVLKSVENRKDAEYIRDRVDYYNKLRTSEGIDKDLWMKDSISLKDQPMKGQKVYYLDSMVYARWFDPSCRWILLQGDITFVPELPSIVKSRPIGDNNANSVLMKLNKVRHFIFVNDNKSFKEKEDRAVFRGKVKDKPIRLLFMEKFFGNSRFDAGAIDMVKAEWKCEKMSIYDHLRYKYVISLEGNDVASNLKWVMSSNSIAVMPRPKYETWFMEGRLKPNYHYIEVKADLSDIEEKMDYYTSHPDEAEAIIKHAHEYVEQFKDSRRERLISLLVLDRYFKVMTFNNNQNK